MAGTILYKMSLDSTQFKSGLNNAKSSLSKAQGDFKRMGGRIAATMGVAFGVGQIISFGKASLHAYDIQAKAEKQLLVALKGRQNIQQQLIKQAQNLQGKTLYGDEETIKAQALIAAFVREEEQIKKIIPLVQDLATAKNMNLAAAADLVSKTLGSSTNALSRYGIQVEGTVGSAERLESLMLGLNDAFGGQAEAAAKTGIGAMTQLQNKWGDLKEQIGLAIAESKKFNQLIDELSKSTTILSSKHLSFWQKINPFQSQEKTYQLALKKQKEYEEAQQKAQKATEKTSSVELEAITVVAKRITTYGNLKEQIADKTKLLEKADITDAAYIRTIYAEIEALKKQKKAFEDLAKPIIKRSAVPAKMQSKAASGVEGGGAVVPTGLADMGGFIEGNKQKLEDLNRSWWDFLDTTYLIADAVPLVSDAFAQMITGTEGAFLNLVGTMLNGIKQVLNGLLAEAIAGMIAGEANKGLLGLATAAVGVGLLTALWQSKVPKMATGGIIPQGFNNDTYPAMLSSGEMVVPKPIPLGSAAGGLTDGQIVGRMGYKEMLFIWKQGAKQKNAFS